MRVRYSSRERSRPQKLIEPLCTQQAQPVKQRILPFFFSVTSAMRGVTAAPAPRDSIGFAHPTKPRGMASDGLGSTQQAKNAVYGRALDNGSIGEAPAAAAASYHDSYVVEPAWEGDLSKLPTGVSRIVGGARKLFEVRTMQEHLDVWRGLLVRDVAYQAPIIAAYDREDFRVAAYLAKSIAYMTLQPQLVEVAPAGYNMTTVSVDGTVVVSPKRSWLFPPSLLLPDIPIRATIKLGVRGPLDTGKIEFIDGRWHNLPSAPGVICRFNGFLMGRVMRWLEPLWSRGLWLVGDNSCSNGKAQ